MNLSDLDLRQFRYFIAVAEELHFGRAAGRLRIAQPAVSQQIQKLEGLLGTRLFERNKRSVRLTEAGAAFLPEALRALDTVRQAAEAAVRTSRGEIGHLTIRFSSSASFGILPEILRRHIERFPGVGLTLRETSSAPDLREVARGSADIEIVRGPIPETADGIVASVLTREPLIAVVPEAHRLAAFESIGVRRLARERFVLFPRHLSPGFYDLIIELCRRHEFSPNVVQEADQWQTVASLVAAGIGVTIAPSSVMLMQRAGARYLALRDCPAKAELVIAFHSESAGPAVHAFVKTASQVAQASSRAG